MPNTKPYPDRPYQGWSERELNKKWQDVCDDAMDLTAIINHLFKYINSNYPQDDELRNIVCSASVKYSQMKGDIGL